MFPLKPPKNEDQIAVEILVRGSSFLCFFYRLLFYRVACGGTPQSESKSGQGTTMSSLTMSSVSDPSIIAL